MKEYFIWLAKVVTVLVAFVVGIPMIIGGIVAATQQNFGPIVEKKEGVAIVEVKGLLEDSREVIKKLHEAVKNENVLGIVLEINSPGGAVGPSQAIYRAVSRLKEEKPIVAVMSAVAASGGLYAALGASEIVAQPGTLTGSIGVVLQLPNFKEVADKVGVKFVTIKSGAFKDVGNAFREMTDKEQEYLQDTVETAQEDFVQAIVDSRGLDKEKVLDFADGRMLLGSQARELGLVDDYGDIYTAARRIYFLSGNELKDSEQPKVFFPDNKFGKLQQLLEGVADFDSFTTQPVRFMFLANAG